MDTIRTLKQVMMFKDVPDPVLQIVARAAEQVTIPAGETLVSVTDTPDALYVIRNGTVRAVLDDGEAPSVPFGTGETIGEAQFIDGSPAGGTVTALERVDLLVSRAGTLADASRRPAKGAYFFCAFIRRSISSGGTSST